MGASNRNMCFHVVYEVLTAVTMEGSIMKSSKMPYSLVKVNRRFEGTYYHHPQGRRVIQARNRT
jgi:hypothetical protein